MRNDKAEVETWKTDVKSATVRNGEIQADAACWANAEGVTVAVTGKDGANLLAGSLTWEAMEALCAAFALLKT